jgi:hypothetical protein
LQGDLTQAAQPARTYEPTPLSLTDTDKALLKALADERFEGNKSMAARFMIRHFAVCQFPLIGIEAPAAGACGVAA